MITFKQYLQEDDEDVIHKAEEAAKVYLENCRQWDDVNVPLYRLSNVQGGGSHPMRTRVPRERKSKSQAGSHEVQEMIFKQAGWSRFPNRQNSIFCSTQKKFEVGEVDEFSENLLMIYPFDGVKLAATTEVRDFNYVDLMLGKNTSPEQLISFHSFIRGWKGTITQGPVPRTESFAETFGWLKKTLLNQGEFDPGCKGDKFLADNLKQLGARYMNEVKFVVTELPGAWTPNNLGVELLQPGQIDLPGDVREVWFSGKYLSIPALDHQRFIRIVKEMKDGTYDPEAESKRKTIVAAKRDE